MLEWVAIPFSTTQGLNPGLRHLEVKVDFYHVSHQGILKY